MINTVFQATVASPEELREKLAAELGKPGFNYKFIALSLTDPKVYVYPFQMPKSPRKQLLEHLIDEAVELSSLHINDIELDFQVFSAKEGIIEGVFVCIPKKLLEEYIAVCDSGGLIPIHFTAQLLRAVGALHTKHQGTKEHFVALDFLKDRVSVAVFANDHCDFMRQIKFEAIDEAKSDIIQSLRSASAKSKVKTIEHIYVGNLTDDAKKILPSIEQSIGAPIITEGDSSASQPPGPADYFKVNLLQNYSFSAERRAQFDLGAKIVLGFLGAVVAINLFHALITQIKIAKIKSSYKPADVKYAKELEQKVNAVQ